eukprot:NODE_3632_length_930_cov_7.834371_g3480_i0.p1 GENE.NODE_3632_length_930_cov_7.834371_g3480_i0~~NODE_3632_length_930_cov_7.834371_g3480_i0.p1  ORF type:complete len:300 (-),score=77.68 NODE_3632_length_930_cov_7.834371_g3480_i0:30-854(-)
MISRILQQFKESLGAATASIDPEYEDLKPKFHGARQDVCQLLGLVQDTFECHIAQWQAIIEELQLLCQRQTAPGWVPVKESVQRLHTKLQAAIPAVKTKIQQDGAALLTDLQTQLDAAEVERSVRRNRRLDYDAQRQLLGQDITNPVLLTNVEASRTSFQDINALCKQEMQACVRNTNLILPQVVSNFLGHLTRFHHTAEIVQDGEASLVQTLLHQIENMGHEHTPQCIICMDNPVQQLLSPCGHYTLCGACAATQTQCPLCNTPVANRITVYM